MLFLWTTFFPFLLYGSNQCLLSTRTNIGVIKTAEKMKRSMQSSLCWLYGAQIQIRIHLFRMKKAKWNHHLVTVAVGNAKYQTDKRIYNERKTTATIFLWPVEGEWRVMGCRMMWLRCMHLKGLQIKENNNMLLLYRTNTAHRIANSNEMLKRKLAEKYVSIRFHFIIHRVRIHAFDERPPFVDPVVCFRLSLPRCSMRF